MCLGRTEMYVQNHNCNAYTVEIGRKKNALNDAEECKNYKSLAVWKRRGRGGTNTRIIEYTENDCGAWNHIH